MMEINRSKFVAVITGLISVFICILYLILITVFDFRTLLNDQLTSLSENIAVILVEIDYSP